MKKKRARSQPVPGRPAPAPATDGRVQVGDVVYRKPVSFSDSDAKNAQTMRVAVVWVHPAGRFMWSSSRRASERVLRGCKDDKKAFC